jgi:trehalose 6-phosphate synthase
LSKFAGAARQLDAALLVNPHDIEGLASAIGEALGMPAEERLERWNAMMKALVSAPLQGWFTDFVTALRAPSLEADVEAETSLLSFQRRTHEAGGRAISVKAGQNLVNTGSRH